MHPELKFTRNKCWLSFNESNSCLYSLDPSEPFFINISAHFIRKVCQQQLFNKYSKISFFVFFLIKKRLVKQN